MRGSARMAKAGTAGRNCRIGWDHRGTTEWVEYQFDHAKKVSAIEVYWFDDTGRGQCRIPKSWRLLYRTAAEWKPVANVSNQPVARDGWNRMTFNSVDTSALRLEVELQSGFSGRYSGVAGKVIP